jgi:hypothetical protein
MRNLIRAFHFLGGEKRASVPRGTFPVREVLDKAKVAAVKKLDVPESC